MPELAAPSSEEFSDRTLVAIHRYWNVKRADKLMPARRDLDPLEMRSFLPNIFMVDVQYNPLCFRYRLIGTAIVAFLGRDYTGRTVDEATYGKGDNLDRLLELFTTVVETRRTIGYKGNIFYVSGREWLQVELLLMPLGADGVTVDIIFAGYVSVGPAEKRPPGTAPAGSGFRIIPHPVIREATPYRSD